MSTADIIVVVIAAVLALWFLLSPRRPTPCFKCGNSEFKPHHHQPDTGGDDYWTYKCANGHSQILCPKFLPWPF